MKNRLEITGAAVALLWTTLCLAAPPAVSPPPPGHPPQAESTKAAVNYVVRVQWKDAMGTNNYLQVLTTEGDFSLNTIQQNPVTINHSNVPTTVTLRGTLTALNSNQGRMTLYLGRTVPYVTSSSTGPGGATSSSYQQLQVGLSSTFIVTFGKPQVIQADENGQVSILVSRQED